MCRNNMWQMPKKKYFGNLRKKMSLLPQGVKRLFLEKKHLSKSLKDVEFP